MNANHQQRIAQHLTLINGSAIAAIHHLYTNYTFRDTSFTGVLSLGLNMNVLQADANQGFCPQPRQRQCQRHQRPPMT